MIVKLLLFILILEAMNHNIILIHLNIYFSSCKLSISFSNEFVCTVVPVMNGHPRDQAKVSVHCRWPLITGNLTLKCVGRGIYNMAVQGRWPLTTVVAQGRYYCIYKGMARIK